MYVYSFLNGYSEVRVERIRVHLFAKNGHRTCMRKTLDGRLRLVLRRLQIDTVRIVNVIVAKRFYS